MIPRVLLVDDEPNVLAALRRQLHGRFAVETATGADEALLKLGGGDGYGVIMSDMRMPGMDGVELLELVRRNAPDVVRIMLTGNADQETAVKAVNRGAIFRFLNKPCGADDIFVAISAGMEQHRLVTAEKELTERTLGGTVGVPVEMLMNSDPAGFGRAMRARNYARLLTGALDGVSVWQLDLAAMLSPLGWTMVAPEIREKHRAGRELTAEQAAIAAKAPAMGADMIAKIPRMEPVAEIVRNYLVDPPATIPAASKALRVLVDLAAATDKNPALGPAFLAMAEGAESKYDPAIFAAVRETLLAAETASVSRVELKNIAELETGYVLVEDLVTADDRAPILKAGFELSATLLSKIANLHQVHPMREPVRVMRAGRV